MKDIIDFVRPEFEQLNHAVATSLDTDVELVDNIGQYIIDAGGKRMRPLLVILCSKALSSFNNDVVRFATTIEYIHTATLLHDDVVDMSSKRRGRKTVNAEWGNAPAVLVGDFIYSRAFELLVAIGKMPLMQLMAETTNRIAAGEVLQLAKAGDPSLDQVTYFDIIRRKTAILFEAACKGAAILAGADEHTQQQLALYGSKLGLGFQIIDDYLDYAGNSNDMGKNVGDDLAEGKTTLPLIYAMQQASAADSEIIAQALINKDINQIKLVCDIVKSTNALTDTLNTAKEQIKDCIEALDQTEIDSATRAKLQQLATLAIERTH